MVTFISNFVILFVVKKLNKSMLEEINDIVKHCDMLLRREDEYLKQVAKELGVRLEHRRE